MNAEPTHAIPMPTVLTMKVLLCVNVKMDLKEMDSLVQVKKAFLLLKSLMCPRRKIESLFIIDIKECSGQNDCDSNADCVEKIGSYDCVCNSGFQGDGKLCEGWSMFVSSNLSVQMNQSVAQLFF
jgi:hypothetical protein